jgi:NTE family protein
MSSDGLNKIALVLSGGGAYGAYEVGVTRALFEGRSSSTWGMPLNPDIFVGTSVGSFNAAVLAMNKGGALASVKDLHAIWTNQVADKGDGSGNGVYRIRGNPGDYLDPRLPGSPFEQLYRLFDDTTALGRAAAPRLLHLLAPDCGLMERFKCLVDISAFLDITPFCHLIEDCIEPQALRKSGKALRVNATGWQTGDCQEFDFPNMNDDETWTALRASAAIPGLFPPVKLWKETFIDGGVVQNTPIAPAIDEGATEIHVVSLNPKMTLLPESHIENTLDIFSRVYTAMLASNIAEDIESARWVNDGIEVMERVDAGEDVDSDVMRQFARVARVIYSRLCQDHRMPKKLTIHRYYPAEYIGDVFGMLNFDSSAINGMIEEGYRDACAHNCKANNCLIPAAGVALPAEELVVSAGL